MKSNAAIVAFLGLLGAVCATGAWAFDMWPVDPANTDPEGQVIGGVPEDPAVWPATFVFRTKDGGCTATAVGTNAILTAAHCVDDNGVGTAAVSGKKVKLTCRHHPDYRPPMTFSADFALCLTETAMTGIPFEIVNTDPELPKSKQKIKLLGFGCLMPDGKDKNFGKLWGGDAFVASKPTHGLYTVVHGGAAVCFGDSGGGAFVDLSSERRVLFAVNSRGDIKTRSWLSTTASKDFLKWAEDWAVENGTGICGVTPEAEGCAGD